MSLEKSDKRWSVFWWSVTRVSVVTLHFVPTLYPLCTSSSQLVGVVSLANWLKPAAINGPFYTVLTADHDGKSEKGDLDHPCHCQDGLSLDEQTWALYLASICPKRSIWQDWSRILTWYGKSLRKAITTIVDMFSSHFQILQFPIF